MEAVRLRGTGDYDFQIVGESFHQITLGRFCGGKCDEGYRLEAVAELVPEDDNLYDANAVAVHINGKIVGHLARPGAKAFRAALPEINPQRARMLCDAIIVGGWDRGGGDVGSYGVRLNLAYPFGCE